jgi:branched-chain amino acid transport system substrate-binding protein
MGDAAVGAFASTFWTEDFDNPQSKKFVADFEAKYGRIPSPNAAQAYDAVMILDAAAKTVAGKVEDAPAFQKALETAKFESLRGHFKFNTNHYPVQDFWLAEIVKDAKGRPTMAKRSLIVADHADAYVDKCAMK